MTPKHAVFTLIIGSALLRLISAFSLGLGNDEAYHFLYAAHPSLSYYDHPPMMAWVEMAGLAMSGFRGVRMGVADRFYPAVRRLDLDPGAVDDSILWRVGGLSGRSGPQSLGILRAGGLDFRLA